MLLVLLLTTTKAKQTDTKSILILQMAGSTSLPSKIHKIK